MIQSLPATSRGTTNEAMSSNDDDIEKGPQHHDLDKLDSNTSSPAATPVITQNSQSTPEESPPHRGRQSHPPSLHSDHSDHDHAPDHQVPTSRSHSRAHSRAQSSLRRPSEKVPRPQRRGLLARLPIIAEVTNAHDYPRKTKWLLTIIIAVAGSAAPMASSIVLPALKDIAVYFHTSPTVVNLSIALYLLSMGVFPLWWSSFSETLGRRTIYLTSFGLYVLFSVLGGVSTNVGMFIAMRVLNGAAGASVQAVGAGTIADLWEVRERGRAIGFFYLGPLCGPLLAPIIGGALNQSLGWRSVQWFLAIQGGIILLLLVFCLPETLKQRKSPLAIAEEEATAAQAVEDAEKSGEAEETVRPTLTRTTTKQSVQVKTRKYLTFLKRCFVDPLRIILYLQFPAVSICVFYATTTFAALYMLNLSVQQTFSQPPYNYSSVIIGLLYIPNSIGYILTSLLGGRWVDHIMARQARLANRYDSKHHLIYRPEDRMQENAWLGAFLFPAAILVYGWTAQYGLPLAIPLVANFFFGVGSMLIFATVTTMLTEFMPRKASNGVALNNFVRNMFACVGGAVTDPLIGAVGNGWLFTGLGVICVGSGVGAILAMRKWGERWRVGMDRKIEAVQGL